MSDEPGPSGSDVGAVLLDLQGVDTAHDQALHRLEVLGERQRHAEAANRLREWEQHRLATRETIATVEAAIEDCESESATIDAKRTRLEAQLKTVIAPREAEALQHEIATLGQQRSDLDDRELELLGEHADAESRLAELVGNEAPLRAELADADAKLAAAEEAINTELGSLAGRRVELSASLPSTVLKRYDTVRAKLGVAAARLAGSRCEGCHLDLSAGELDTVRRSDADQIPDCPQCGRMLIR
ncbi:C4-type zinc ribbon domain-containing protein [Ilumatobacteraceae bacterium]|nr:C4-type zinc ribbon domain-containing protein [Ilumatobacteraceae bacterium]